MSKHHIQREFNSRDLEKYSSAFTLSDMEIFIFPELLYALVYANIMSPEIWKWRDDPWFAGIEKMGPLKKVHRVKQYIMEHYDFNLDLETWGLTDKQTEINRFRDFIDMDTLARSNALFGYEGDKYYFDLDIRKHFGLDKFDTEIIPYWKTETVEAMNAFRFKPDHQNGAGECVSLACLYVAALFIVARVPLEDIYMMGTPLHSQNFVLIDEGVITNNRRIVTKSMWYNGTELSALARRAMEHEQVTIVAHPSGYIHSVYPEATIDKVSYKRFRDKLSKYLETQVNFEIFVNFLRDYSRYQKLFQIAFFCQGTNKFIKLERAFGYEHGSKNRLGDKTGRKLLCEMDEEEMNLTAYPTRLIVTFDDGIFNTRPYQDFLNALLEKYPSLKDNHEFTIDLKKFVHLVPQLPSDNKTYIQGRHLLAPIVHSSGVLVSASPNTISPSSSREEIINLISSMRDNNPTADLAFYAGRFMDSCDWKPFLKAVFERSPVSVAHFKEQSLDEIYAELKSWPDESIYEGNRLALPDEVVNYKRGDGIEKAVTMMNSIKSRHKDDVHLQVSGTLVKVKGPGFSHEFVTAKTLEVHI
ncbi:MAG: hypothetical protein NTY96_11505 [Bacteroidetes bacterium]|nr:hypothetical protein [Bacteroidota bacterium]